MKSITARIMSGLRLVPKRTSVDTAPALRPPGEPRQMTSEMVRGNPFSKGYHRPGCEYGDKMSHPQIFVSFKEAQSQGYKPMNSTDPIYVRCNDCAALTEHLVRREFEITAPLFAEFAHGHGDLFAATCAQILRCRRCAISASGVVGRIDASQTLCTGRSISIRNRHASMRAVYRQTSANSMGKQWMPPKQAVLLWPPPVCAQSSRRSASKTAAQALTCRTKFAISEPTIS